MVNQLGSQISTLYALAHELLYLGVDDTPIYSDYLIRLNRDVFRQANLLYGRQGATDEEEALLCLSLLMAYNAAAYNNGDKEMRVQHLLDRCWAIIEHLPASLLKCQLLVACYGEVFDKELAQEAHAIMDAWKGCELTKEAYEVIERLKDLEENPYPWSEV